MSELLGLLVSAAALLAPAPAPERGVAVVLQPVSGRVYVRPDHVRLYRRLRGSERLPVGTTVDAQEGTVRLTVTRDGRGRFRTAGRYSAATVRGTRWLTEDRCDGTLTRVVRGEVVVEDFTVQRPEPPPAGAEPPAARTPEPAAGESGGIVVQRGGSYVARPGS